MSARLLTAALLILGLHACSQPTAQQTSAPASAAQAGDWARAKLIADPALRWMVHEGESGAHASYAAEQSDWVIVTLHCPEPHTLAFEYVDQKLDPNARYETRVRIDDREVSAEARTSERWDMDDLVALEARLPADRNLVGKLSAGGDFGLLYRRTGSGGEWSGLIVRGDAAALAALASDCES
jgi:hypothetical protein